MMMDSYTVFRKEMQELLASRQAFRGVLVQGGIVVTLTGIVVPALNDSLWQDVSTATTLFFIFPSVLAASMAADAFAGERERKTLETLLATPLSDRAIFAGKAASAVAFAWAVSVLSLLTAVVTANVKTGFAPLFVPPAALCIGTLSGALGASFVTAAAAIIVSYRLPVARAVQQISQVLSLVLAFGTSLVIQLLGVPIVWPLIFKVDAVLLCLGAILLSSATLLFRRDRFLM